MNYLIYSNVSCVTGRRLADYLGVESGTSGSMDTRPDHLIRWGSSQGVTYVPEVQTWNLKDAVEANTNKFASLQKLRNNGVPVPPFSRRHSDLEYPMLGRSRNHTQGSDIDLIMQSGDAERSDSHHYVEYVPVDREYRVHVINGQVVKVHEKRVDEPEESVPWMRNYEHGCRYVRPQSDDYEEGTAQAVAAVHALDLHFGAVDMILGEDGEFYVLEVNTAPSLDEPSFEVYAERIADMVGLSDVPGMEAVEWDDEDESDSQSTRDRVRSAAGL